LKTKLHYIENKIILYIELKQGYVIWKTTLYYIENNVILY